MEFCTASGHKQEVVAKTLSETTLIELCENQISKLKIVGGQVTGRVTPQSAKSGELKPVTSVKPPVEAAKPPPEQALLEEIAKVQAQLKAVKERASVPVTRRQRLMAKAASPPAVQDPPPPVITDTLAVSSKDLGVMPALKAWDYFSTIGPLESGALVSGEPLYDPVMFFTGGLKLRFSDRVFVQSNRVAIGHGKFFTVDKLRTANYINFYCTTAGKSQALASIRPKKRTQKVDVGLPVDLATLQAVLPHGAGDTLRAGGKASGQFKVFLRNVDREGLVMVLDAIKALVDAGTVLLPPPSLRTPTKDA